MVKICVFDVNETLLDLKVLDPEFDRVFNVQGVRKEWFSQFIQSALVATITDNYRPFGQIGAAAFDMTVARHKITVSDQDKKAILGKLVALPPHPEVQASLQKLKQAGYQIAALTNSTFEVAEKQLQFAGILEYFDKVLSADAVQRFKPSLEPYLMAAEAFGVNISEIYLIAAHAWDITGATHAGCKTAFVARPGAVINPLTAPPTIIGNNISDVVEQLIKKQ